MPRAKCIQAVLDVTNGAINEKEAQTLVRNINSIKKRVESKGGGTPEFRESVFEFLNDFRADQAWRRIQTAENAIKYKRNWDVIEKFLDKNPEEGLLGLITRSEEGSKGIGNSVGNFEQSIRARLQNGVIWDLEQGGVLEAFVKGDYDKGVIIQLEKLNMGEKLDGTEAEIKIAKALKTAYDSLYREKKEAGSPIRKIKNYLGKQTHDREKILSVREDDYKNFLRSVLDEDKTFKGMSEPEIKDFIDGVYRDIVEGKPPKVKNGEIQDFLAVGENVAKRLSRERVLHFKNAESFYEYNNKFGIGSYAGNFFLELEKTARDTALMRVFGTNPENMIQRIVKQIDGEMRSRSNEITAKKGEKGELPHQRDRESESIFERVKSDFKESRSKDPLVRWRSRSVQNKIDMFLSTAQGVHRQPAITDSGKIFQHLRSLNTMSKLGAGVLMTVPDFATAVSRAYTVSGSSFFESQAGYLKNYFGAIKGEKNRRLMLKLSGQALEILSGAVHARIGLDGETPGAMARAQNLFFKSNFLQQQTDAGKAALGFYFSGLLGEMSDRAFKELPDDLKLNLERFNISDTEWGLLKNAVDEAPGFGTRIMTPELSEQIPSKDLEGVLRQKGLIKKTHTDQTVKRKVEAYRSELDLNLRNFLNDVVTLGVPTSNTRVEANLLRGTTKDQPEGILFRSAAQFRTYPVILYQYYNRLLKTNPQGAHSKSAYMRVAALAGAMTTLGYAMISLRALFENREPPEMSPEVAVEAALKGGALGLIGDFAIGETKRERLGLSVLGPTAGTITDILKFGDEVFLSATDENKEVNFGKLLRLTKKNVPFQNHFLLSPIINGLGFDSLMMQIDPEYMIRRERRYEERGQDEIF